MKIVAFSDKTGGVCIENDNGEQGWFSMTAPVKNFIKNFKKGDEVSIEYQPNTTGRKGNTITRITPAGKPASSKTFPTVTKDVASTNTPTVTATAVPSIPSGVGGVFSREESIVRQSVLKAVGGTMAGLNGQINLENWKTVAKEVFDFYMSIITKG